MAVYAFTKTVVLKNKGSSIAVNDRNLNVGNPCFF